jgi:hypothetical protein
MQIIVIIRLGDSIETKTQRLIDKPTEQEKDMIMGNVHTQ